MVPYLCACTCVCVHTCGSERETEISGWVYVCVRVVLWDAVIWCTGGQDENSDDTCVNHIHVCDTVDFTAHFCN